MDKRLYVKEGDLEVRANQFLVNFRTHDEGPIRYEFDNVITIEVEEEQSDKKQIKRLQYRNFFLECTDGIYRPNGIFTENVGNLFNKLLHHGGPYKGPLCKAVEGYMNGQSFPQHIRLEKGQESSTLIIDLRCL